jgi:hypothetical protein
MWWPYGWRGRSPDGRRVFCVQTNCYGLAMDVDHARLTNLGALRDAPPDAAAVFKLPAVQLVTRITVGDRVYAATSAAPALTDVRIIEHGRFLQRLELQKITLIDETTREPLDGVDASFELVCWPDRLVILLRVRPRQIIETTSLSMALRWEDPGWRVDVTGARARRVQRVDHVGGITVMNPGEATWEGAAGGAQVGLTTPAREWDSSKNERTLALVIAPADANAAGHEKESPDDALGITATGIAPYKDALTVKHDPLADDYTVRLGDASLGGWTPAGDPDRLERVAVHVENASEVTRTARLRFSKLGAPVAGVIGMTPMIRDAAGVPVGLPVQISKNWHRESWFDGPTMLEVPPRRAVDLEFTIAYERWGGVPAVSHAQLCLIGYGGNQLWHEVALGSFGEAIFYDPDVVLGRGMIDDMRPLLVRPAGTRADEKWGWTNNVGGGDFLVYIDGDGRRQRLNDVRTTYERYGPNLAQVTYAGHTDDGRIDGRIGLSHFRSDDFTRAVYHLRYDVRRATSFRRLVFFQLGADVYNAHQFRRLARGNRDGLLAEWEPAPEREGGRGYDRVDVPCPGPVGWISLHKAMAPSGASGAWPDRGLIVRSFRARLGGRETTTPLFGFYRTRDTGDRRPDAKPVPSVSVELTPPFELGALTAGDFVDCQLELLILPASAKDYLGPNDALRKALASDGDTWRMVRREAVGNDLDVVATAGTVEQDYPFRIRCDAAGNAAFQLRRGIGYVPITLTGVNDYRRCSLERRVAAGRWARIDQSVHGNDFWQAEFHPDRRTWDLSFNLPADEPAADGKDQSILLRLAPTPP